MFAKHLLQSVSYKRPQPTFTPSNTGEYIDPTTGRRYRVVARQYTNAEFVWLCRASVQRPFPERTLAICM